MYSLDTVDHAKILQAIVDSDEDLLKRLAFEAIISGCDIAADIAKDDPDGVLPLPTNDDVRRQTVMYISDVLKDFGEALIKQILETKFDAGITAKRVVKTKLVFE